MEEFNFSFKKLLRIISLFKRLRVQKPSDHEQETQLKSLAHSWFNQKRPQSGKPTRGFGPIFGNSNGDCNGSYDGDCDGDWNI